MNMKKYLTLEEIELLLNMEGETSWARAHEILNGKRIQRGETVLLNRSWFFEGFLKRHGCRDGKMRGFKYVSKQEVVKEIPVENITKQEVVKEIPVENITKQEVVKEIPESCSDCISVRAMALLKFFYHERLTKISLSAIIRDNNFDKNCVYNAASELAENGILQKKVNNQRAFELPNWEEIYTILPDFKVKPTQSEYDCLKGKKKNKKKQQIINFDDYIQKAIDWMESTDSVKDMEITLPKFLGIDDSYHFMKFLIEKDIVCELEGGRYCPTFSWQKSMKIQEEQVDDGIIWGDPIPSQKNDKDIVLDLGGRNVRLIIGSNDDIQITVQEKEVVIKIK